MTRRIEKGVKRETGTGTDLWRVILAPVIWTGHFLFIYIYAAVFCEKAGRNAPLLPVQWATMLATLAALAGIALVTRRLWRVRARSLTENDFDFEHNSPEERHRFLSHVAVMLCALSAVAVLYTSLPALYLDSCR